MLGLFMKKFGERFEEVMFWSFFAILWLKTRALMNLWFWGSMTIFVELTLFMVHE